MDIKKNWVLVIPIAVILFALIYTLFRAKNKDDFWVGMIETTYVDVASELPGRVDSMFVVLGDTVEKGQRLAKLKTHKMEAIIQQANAAVEIAENQLTLLKNGNAKEVIDAMENLYELANEQYELTKKTYERMNNLYQDGVISGEERDIIAFKYKAAQKELETTKSNLALAKKGSRSETINIAESMLKQAQENAELIALAAVELALYAPKNGVVSAILLEEGEITSPGYPLITLLDPNAYFAVFQIPQDHIQHFKEGDIVQSNIPGISDEKLSLKVSSISPMLDFANWVPSKDLGKFDLRSFEVKLKPIEKKDEIRAGMTLSIPK